MACVIDHLRVDHRFRVLQDFVDLHGSTMRAGDTAILRDQGVDWARQEIFLDWEVDGRVRKFQFRLTDRTGPGNGRMRQYFELEEPVGPPGGWKLRRGNQPPVALPEVAPRLIRDFAHLEAAMERIWALAGRLRFDEAREQLKALLEAPGDTQGRLQCLAEELGALAWHHAWDADATVYEWFRDQSLGMWYAYGSGATSGGEGAAFSLEIRRAEENFAHLDRRRAEDLI